VSAAAAPSIRPCETDLWLNRNGSINGYHVLCVMPQRNSDSWRDVQFYRNGVLDESSGNETIDATEIDSGEDLRTVVEKMVRMKKTDSRRQRLPKKDRYQKWQMYDSEGRIIRELEQFYGTVLVFEGGMFVYPPIEIGLSILAHVRFILAHFYVCMAVIRVSKECHHSKHG